ncbi:unnamed protein product [Nyctereutes procyonoides]|uniref:(raccoon dog) hypothetical protein n=1 Tax=Nyctereutes procyonoides TaxID=34880 RepID=A0A811YWX9_NYCPR|nr:unnamed protein product [Nyctereutes procyonoides]
MNERTQHSWPLRNSIALYHIKGIYPPRKSNGCKYLCSQLGSTHGFYKAAPALDKRQVHLCVFASIGKEPMYAKVVVALCTGFHKIDIEGKILQVVSCVCVIVKDYGKESQAKDTTEKYFKFKK